GRPWGWGGCGRCPGGVGSQGWVGVTLGPPQDPRVRLSKALSYVLRHGAEAAGLPMGPGAGTWGTLGGILEISGSKRDFEDPGRDFGEPWLDFEDPGRVFGYLGWDFGNPGRVFGARGRSRARVRGSQVPELELTPLRTPGALPPTLAHGTRRRLWGPIRAGGLRPMGRQHLHLAGGLPGDPGVRSGESPPQKKPQPPQKRCELPLDGPWDEEGGETPR
ncbi:tRNA 2'-phosphotransferase 1, partial [Passer montanus]|uniref:tRNA 2'-phosphotransferase 1 n=1 Tax=Passer montanus TaxID=9160 RepID=UPI00195F9A3A